MSKIEWTDTTWNPVTGCTKISPGCAHCYAERMAKRLAGRYGYPADEPFRVTLHPDRLEQPLHFRGPRMIFVCSMGDLFHVDVPFDFIDRVFAVMALCPQHIFQVLTKRPERMAEYLNRFSLRTLRSRWAQTIEEQWPERGAATAYGLREHGAEPLPNVWLGTSIENQKAADERIPHLLGCPAAVRFLSAEPLLGPIFIDEFHFYDEYEECLTCGTAQYAIKEAPVCGCETDPDMAEIEGTALANWKHKTEQLLHWLILGGESGPGARPCDVQWISDLLDQCAAAGVPAFVKQLGAHVIDSADEEFGPDFRIPLKSAKGGDPAEWPERLRVRQWPEVKP